ncbi:MAG: hypothetical protein ACSHW7_13130 [Patiriisocius sp.]|uniref:hypothetical protein n=1 Tax=Patiriisocius sp. TaxID=2822396 RepID=UPI003EFAE5F7
MERIKFEENSREKFEERELQPSAGAWNKLEGMLNEAQPKKKKGGFPWLAVAASFIGFVIIASIYFNQNDSEDSLVNEDTPSEILKTENNKSPFKTVEEINKENEAVANTETENEAMENGTDELKNSAKTTQNDKDRIATSDVNKNTNPSQKTQQGKSSVLKTINNTPYNNAGQISAVPNDKGNAITGENKEGMSKISETSISKVDEVVAQIKDAQNKNGTVTEAEINTLLASAQQDLKLQNLLDINTGKVDAMALLGEVEMEMEQSFRDKVFYALGEGFEQLRTSISDRNN